MYVSRRRLLSGGIAAFVTAAIPATPLGILVPATAGAAPATATGRSAPLTQATFAACLNTPFRVRADSKPVDIILVQVSPGIRPSPAGECFSLLFDGNITKAFPSGTYTVTHASLGSFPMFVGPVDKPVKSMTYEAVFTRW